MQAKLKVAGIGDARCNIVNRLIEDKIDNVSYLQINTDINLLKSGKSNSKIIIGKKTTQGLGCGTDAIKGKNAAIEAAQEIKTALEGTDMLFIVSGLGGGTGSGASSIVSRVAKEMGIVTIVIVTTPFKFEGKQRALRADNAIEDLKEFADALIIVSNNKLVEISPKDLTVKNAFKIADSVLKQALIGITRIITDTGNINIDYADVQTILSYKGGAYIGFGVGTGDTAIVDAINDAIENPITQIKIDNAKGVILSFVGNNMSLFEINDSLKKINDRVADDANIIFGTQDSEDEDIVRVIIIATGIEQS